MKNFLKAAFSLCAAGLSACTAVSPLPNGMAVDCDRQNGTGTVIWQDGVTPAVTPERTMVALPTWQITFNVVPNLGGSGPAYDVTGDVMHNVNVVHNMSRRLSPEQSQLNRHLSTEHWSFYAQTFPLFPYIRVSPPANDVYEAIQRTYRIAIKGYNDICGLNTPPAYGGGWYGFGGGYSVHRGYDPLGYFQGHLQGLRAH